MYKISDYCWYVFLFALISYGYGLVGIIIAFISFPIQTGVVHAVYVIFHVCDAVLIYLFHKIWEKEEYHLRLLSAGKYV